MADCVTLHPAPGDFETCQYCLVEPACVERRACAFDLRYPREETNVIPIRAKTHQP